ncbi:MAG: PDZ domain-containing protein, partial [Holophagales bacterium]|nr:PDZ domain-containing protein [Holophagales bacterium]
SGIAARDPAWSPDGRRLVWASDRGDSYDLWLASAEQPATAEKLTDLGATFLFDPRFAPDGESLSVWDKEGRLWRVEIPTGSASQISQLPVHVAEYVPRVSWSPGSRWLAWAAPDRVSGNGRIFLHDTRRGTTRAVTRGMFSDSWPVFGHNGDYLYLVSGRELSTPASDAWGTTWVYDEVESIYAMPLRADVEIPLLPTSDEESEEDSRADSPSEADAGADLGDRGVEIELGELERRMVRLPVSPGTYSHLALNDQGNLLYLSHDRKGGGATLETLELEAGARAKPRTVATGVQAFEISADGKRLLLRSGDTSAVVEARPDQGSQHLIATEAMIALVDPRREWEQIFREAWRIQRDWFYDEKMHHVDWEEIYERYRALLPEARAREDVTFLIGEMIAELNVGHAYVRGGDIEETESLSVGLLGCVFERADGVFRIAKIFRGGPWDTDARNPLIQAGIREGELLLAVNGREVDTERDPWASLLGLADQIVTLTVSGSAEGLEERRDVVVRTLSSERRLLYRDWVESRRLHVEQASGGRLGYLYLPDTAGRGQTELVRQFIGQSKLDGLILDARWNGGGQIPTRFLELLDRPTVSYFAGRGAQDLAWPPDGHSGPKAMIVNGSSGSGGDYLPWLFQRLGLGKVFGTRTWGGMVGIHGNPSFIDGGWTTAPSFGLYEADGTWAIEGYGVEPDVEVIDDPASMSGGRDPQLDAAITHLLRQLEADPPLDPPRPPSPDRSGLGIPKEDH